MIQINAASSALEQYIQIGERGRRIAVKPTKRLGAHGSLKTESTSQHGWKAAAFRAVLAVLCYGWVAASAAAVCLPYSPGGAPASDHFGGHALLEPAPGAGGAGDACCVFSSQGAFVPVLAAASPRGEPDPSAAIVTRVETPQVEQVAAPVTTNHSFATVTHPPFYLLYSRLLIPYYF